MKIHLIRHAEPNRQTFRGDDVDRPLTEKGHQDAIKLGETLKSKLHGCEVWCSGANRTRQTLEEMQKQISFGECTFFPEFHLCPKETYLSALMCSDSTEDIVIVGHNFGISHLVTYLSGDHLLMEPGEYICIAFEGLKRNEVSMDTGIIVDRYLP